MPCTVEQLNDLTYTSVSFFFCTGLHTKILQMKQDLEFLHNSFTKHRHCAFFFFFFFSFFSPILIQCTAPWGCPMVSVCDLFGQYDLSAMGQPEAPCSGCFWAAFWLLLVKEVWGGCPGTSNAGKEEQKTKHNIKLNHVVTSSGDCTCNKVNGNCGVCVVGVGG